MCCIITEHYHVVDYGGVLSSMQERVFTYELKALEGIVTNELLSSNTKTRSESLPNSTRELLDIEIERVKKTFVHEVFAFEDERHLERYIQFHQQELIRLADEVATRFESTADIQIPSDNIGYFYHAIEELLQFIERHFSKYFDQDAKAPASYITRIGGDVVKWYREYNEKLTAQHIDTSLIELALYPFKRFIEQIPGGPITYRKIIYVKEIQKDLSQTLASNDSQHIDQEIRNNFIYLNYNTLKYFRFYTNYVVSLTANIESLSTRIEKLSYQLKVINQTQVKPGVSYNRTIRSLKDQIVDWLAEEIAYLERLHERNEKNSAAVTVDETFRIKTEMSVSQLAYLVKLLVDIKIIQNQNISDVMRFFAKFFQAKRLERISYESFRVRFYNAEDGTKRSVRSILLSLVDHINKG